MEQNKGFKMEESNDYEDNSESNPDQTTDVLASKRFRTVVLMLCCLMTLVSVILVIVIVSEVQRANSSKAESNGENIVSSSNEKLSNENVAKPRWTSSILGSSCADHKQTGQTTSGWYEITDDTNRKVVYCDMTDNGARDCSDHRQAGKTISGWYEIEMITGHRKIVYCDMETAQGGWTMLLRRIDGSVDFNENWENYKRGFGNLNEFWIGNDVIHELTMQNGRQYQLRFDLRSNTNGSRYATYSNLTVADESSKYTIMFGDYWGNAGDSFSYHKDQRFTTIDRDNDKNPDNCAQMHTGGWWYCGICHEAHLTGLYGQNVGFAKGLDWYHWLGFYDFLDYADMKIKPE